MVNWSDFVVVLQGNAEDIKNAFEELNLKLNNDYLVPNGYNVVANVSIKLENHECIVIYGQGKWIGPSKFINEFFERYSLCGCYTDMECGMDRCFYIEFGNGQIVDVIRDRYFSDLSIDMTGISYMVDRLSWIPEEDNWEEEYQYHIALFEKHGMTLNQLKQAWQDMGVKIA